MILAALPVLLVAAALGKAPAPATRAAPPPAAAQPPPAPAQPAPALDELVRRASAAQEKRPEALACRVAIRAALLGTDGATKELQEQERTERWESGVARRGPITKVVIDGRPLPAAEVAEAAAEDQRKQADLEARSQRGEGKELAPIFATARLPLTVFELLREETLAGRRAYVLGFKPRPGAKDGRAGTAWIDASTFAPLRISSSPLPLPDHVDSLVIDEEQQLTAQGEVAPLRTKIESAGGFFFLRRHLRLETTWSDCRSTGPPR